MTALPVPCSRCGWQYDEEVLAACERGEVHLDPLPTHFCVPADHAPQPVPKGDYQPQPGTTKGVCFDCGQGPAAHPGVIVTRRGDVLRGGRLIGSVDRHDGHIGPLRQAKTWRYVTDGGRTSPERYPTRTAAVAALVAL